MSAHTPGPWRYWLCAVDSDNGMRDYAQVESENGPVARIAVTHTTEPDMRLIAAAPDLLEALEQAKKYVAFAFDQGIEGAEKAGLDLDAAIAKARGEP